MTDSHDTLGKIDKFDPVTPQSELTARLAAFQNTLQKRQVDGALILQKADLFYFSGTAQQGWLYIPAQGEPLLMIFKDYFRAAQESGLPRVISLVSAKQIPDRLSEYGYPSPSILGLELDVLTANQYLAFQEIFTGCTLTDISTDIRLQRAVKSNHEIGLIRQSSRMADRVAARIPELLQEGVTEIEFAGQVEAYARSLGHQGLIRMRMWDSDLFYGHIMSGPDAAAPSCFASPTGGRGVHPSIGQGPGFNTLKQNQPILVDYVFVLNGYISDHTRIFAMGRLEDDLLRAHDSMLDIQEKVKQAAVPGAVSGDIYQMMISLVKEKSYEKYFMGAGERRIRFTGHGIGLELDEFPFIAQNQSLPLEKGMVIALEPKIVIPGKGVVGIENSLLVTDTGLESLTLFHDGITFV